MSRDFNKAVKLAAWERAGGRCEGCTAKLYVGKFQYDHRSPHAVSGDSSLFNCQVLCTNCHDEKTNKRDKPYIAKSNRIRAKHAGIRKRRGFRGWRRFDGSIVYARD